MSTLRESPSLQNAPEPIPSEPENAIAYVATAARIGARICRDAIWHRGRCNWLGSSMEVVDGAWATVTRSFGPDLYSGTSGIALFLGRLFDATGETIFRDTAIGAINQALSRM